MDPWWVGTLVVLALTVGTAYVMYAASARSTRRMRDLERHTISRPINDDLWREA